MSGFIEGEDRSQATLFPERIDDYVAEDSPVRVVDVFIDDLKISGLGFRTQPNATTELPSKGDVEAVCVRLSEPCAVEPTTGT